MNSQIVVLLVASISCVRSQVWGPPYFIQLENPVKELVYGNETEGGLVLYLDEEVPADDDNPLYLIKINYSGTSIPSLSMRFGSFALLKPKLIKVENEYFVAIAERQDYENPDMQRYRIQIAIDGVSRIIFLNIENIDDEIPLVNSTSCEIPELYVGVTNCTFNVNDADGFISTDVMTYRIQMKPGEEDFFRVVTVLREEYTIAVTLETIKELNFFNSQLHVFEVIAIDSMNEGRSQMIVRVIDVPNMPPVWTRVFAVQKYDEKQARTFQLEAIDGDTQLDMPICYNLADVDPKHKDLFSINTNTGLLDVKSIDRDFWKQEVFEFVIVAYKCDNVSSDVTSSVAIIVNDINDNRPEIAESLYELTIPEETFLTLNFDTAIEIEDIDLGTHATYDVSLLNPKPEMADAAFQIIPNAGYQKQSFQITIVNASILDFDKGDWENVTLMLQAKEIKPPYNSSTSLIVIHLENWNDEVPIFTNTTVNIKVLETVPKGTHLAKIKAFDRDIGDRVIHSLVGSVNSILNIDPIEGDITVSVENAFDYHRQDEIVVQVLATDTLGEPYHTAYAQLTIELVNVNINPPEITMPRITPEVKENVPHSFIISDEIQGRDPDLDADIKFSINWTLSYATKQGRPTPAVEYEGCVEIETVYTDTSHKRNAVGRIKAREIRDNVTIDFENFEVLYLVIGLTDNAQVPGTLGYVEAMLTINIIDLNDNPPLWVSGTLGAKRFVREEADSETVIGSVQAIDIDGPEFNVVSYYIRPMNSTPENLVKIDRSTGQIDVNASKAIDADVPKRYHLYYDVTATDCSETVKECFETTDRIEIDITDTNNKVPYFRNELELVVIEIYENETTGYEIVTVDAHDLDRDVMYHTIDYTVDYQSYPELRKYFSVNSTTGVLIVDLQDGIELDRDNPATATHDIYLIISDNYLLQGDRIVRQNRTMIYLVLLDVNDNPPVLPPPSEYAWSISENTNKSVNLSPNVTAPDADEPNTDNSRVQYEILSIEAVDPDIEPFPKDLFIMLSPDNVSGILQTNHNLKDYWGEYDIWIKAFDLGIPSLSTNETYKITVRPYNYMEPVITFPTNESIIRLAKETATPGSTLYTTKNVPLELLTAVDKDGLHAGIVQFDIIGPDAAREYFRIENMENNRGRLVLTKSLDTTTSFELRIRAMDGGTEPGPKESLAITTIIFVSTIGQPVYDNNTQGVRFTEFDIGMSESVELYTATDPKNSNCTDDCREIFYHIVDGETKDFFRLVDKSNILRLQKPLNRTVVATHTFRIVASNSEDPPEIILQPDSVLTVTVLVREENPKPNFENNRYTAGMTKSDETNRLLLIVKATHTENLVIKYSMDEEITVTDSSLEDIKSRAFRLNADTGELFSTFRPSENMKGIFQFNIIATDTDSKTSSAAVSIFIVSDLNRVTFIFDNDIDQISEERGFIAQVLSTSFGNICNIDEIEPTSNDKTSVITHFIGEDNLPVDSKEIEDKKTDIALMTRLQNELNQRSLQLSDFGSTNPDTGTPDSLEKTLQIILIVVSTVLGALCIVLLIAYCIRTRSLNARLEGLIETKFVSQNSGLNRIGVAVVPGTNKHAIEGSNPVWKEDIDTQKFDTISNTSGDSELIGIENDPQFAYNNDKKPTPETY